MSKISQYAPAATLTGVELIPAVQSGSTVTLTPAAIYTYVFTGFGANTFPARSSSGALAAKPITDYALTLLDDADAATALATLGAQPADGSLTALAGQNWAANSFPIGSGPDTLTQVNFAANTFPARSSAGNLVAKPVTDFALTILDDANAAAVLTTLGVPTLAHGTYTPTLFNTLNVAASVPDVCQWLRVGNTVTVSGSVQIDVTAVGNTQLGMTLPVASTFSSPAQLGGTAASSNEFLRIRADSTNARALLESIIKSDTANATFYFTFSYRIVP